MRRPTMLGLPCMLFGRLSKRRVRNYWNLKINMSDETELTDDEFDMKQLLIKGTYINEMYGDIYIRECDD